MDFLRSRLNSKSSVVCVTRGAMRRRAEGGGDWHYRFAPLNVINTSNRDRIYAELNSNFRFNRFNSPR